jgi:hypothetical protein
MSAKLSKAAARVGTTVKMSGSVQPSHAGQVVRLQRWTGKAWTTVATEALSRSSTFSFSITRTSRGAWAYRVAKSADRDHEAVVSRALRFEAYTLHTYVVRTKGKIVVDVESFAAQAAQTYADRRGWAAAHRRFQRVSSGGAFTLVLAEASQVPTYSSVCSSTYSCRVGRYVIINQNRWRYATSVFRKAGGSVRDYRHMVVNHETGHWLGNGHAYCGGDGQLAPVMQQQSKGLNGCRINPWPKSSEIRANG